MNSRARYNESRKTGHNADFEEGFTIAFAGLSPKTWFHESIPYNAVITWI